MAPAPPPPAPGTRPATTAHLAPDGHPAHALLSVAHALLCPAGAMARSKPPAPSPAALPMLPIDELTMPEESVSDLRDVVEAINKLCETMKTSAYDEVCDDPADADPEDPDVGEAAAFTSDALSYSTSFASFSQDTMSCCSQDNADQSLNASTAAPSSADLIESVTEVVCVEYRNIELVSPGEITPQKVETNNAERWSDSVSQISLPGQVEDVETITSDTEPAMAQCEPVSEMYYTASSEVSLLSDTELPEKMHTEDENKEAKDDRKECVIAGHVAAMRERFESMTRTSTPCPDLIRSLSPSLEVFRTTSSSPDRLE